MKVKTYTYTYHRQWSSIEDHNRHGMLVQSRQGSFQVLKTDHDFRCSLVPDW